MLDLQVFEYWLHPQRYRTQMCRDGASCTRKVCFFAHSDLELRHVPGTSADASDPFSKAAKFSLSGMKRQKSTSLSQTSPGSAHSCSSRDRSSSGGGSTSSSRAVVQPAYHTQGLDLVPALSMDALSNCSTGSHVYPSNMLRNSSMDVSSGSRKSSWAEYSCNLAGNLDASMLGPAAGLYAVGPLTPPQQPLQSPGGGVPTLDALFNTNSAIPQTITGAVQAGPWTQNTASPTAGPAAVTACLGLPSAAIHSSNSVTDAAAYLQMLSAYQQRSETCRLQAAMADAAATAVAGKLHASCNALGWPENSILPQPANLACGLSAGLATSGLGIADLTGVTWRDLETVPQYPATDLAAPASLALSGFTGGSLNDLAAPSLSNLPLIYQATAGVAAGSQQLPGLRAHELLVAAASAAAQAGLPVGSYPLMGQLQSTLLA